MSSGGGKTGHPSYMSGINTFVSLMSEALKIQCLWHHAWIGCSASPGCCWCFHPKSGGAPTVSPGRWLAPRCKSPWTEARISGCEWFQKLTSSLRRCGVGVIHWLLIVGRVLLYLRLGARRFAHNGKPFQVWVQRNEQRLNTNLFSNCVLGN